MKSDFGRIVIYTSGIEIGNQYKGKVYQTSGCGVYFGDNVGYSERNPAKYGIKWDREHAEAFAVELALKHCREKSFDHIEIRTTSKHLADAFNRDIKTWTKDAELRGSKDWVYTEETENSGRKIPYQRYSYNKSLSIIRTRNLDQIIIKLINISNT